MRELRCPKGACRADDAADGPHCPGSGWKSALAAPVLRVRAFMLHLRTAFLCGAQKSLTAGKHKRIMSLSLILRDGALADWGRN